MWMGGLFQGFVYSFPAEMVWRGHWLCVLWLYQILWIDVQILPSVYSNSSLLTLGLSSNFYHVTLSLKKILSKTNSSAKKEVKHKNIWLY